MKGLVTRQKRLTVGMMSFVKTDFEFTGNSD